LKMMKPTSKRAHESILGPVVRSLTSFQREKGGVCGKAVRRICGEINLWPNTRITERPLRELV
jgi:hypothetical protein